MCSQWCIQRFFENTVFSRGIQGLSPKGHNCELWTTIFSYKQVWMAWVEVTYYRKCNYYAFINCIRHFVRGEFIQNYLKIFSFLLIWDKNLGSHTGWSEAKPLWICPWFCHFVSLDLMKKNIACKTETNSAIWHITKTRYCLDERLFINVKLVKGSLKAC